MRLTGVSRLGTPSVSRTTFAKGGRRIVAWDEVLEDELDDDVVILWWGGMRGAEVGVARGLDVISCPTSYCYFDYRQSEDAAEPVPVGTAVTLERVYSFDPMPKGEPLRPYKGRVIGGQANLWSEFMNTSRSYDFAAFPRAAALAEVLWSGPGQSVVRSVQAPNVAPVRDPQFGGRSKGLGNLPQPPFVGLQGAGPHCALFMPHIRLQQSCPQGQRQRPKVALQVQRLVR